MTKTVIPMHLAFDEIASKVGSIGQVARADLLQYEDGPSRGTRLIRVQTGGGLTFDVHPDRGGDIGAASFRGANLTWLSPAGFPTPGLRTSDDTQWLRTFGGGLLTTCGLTAFGPPGEDQFGSHGLHGRYSSLPAAIETLKCTPSGIEITLKVHEHSVLSENLENHRRIFAPTFGNTIRLQDEVTNLGSSSKPLMVLYHCNFGWPLVDTSATISSNGKASAHSQKTGTWNEILPPKKGFIEEVYRHDFRDSIGEATISNPELGISAQVSFDRGSLPVMYQWRLLDEREYVIGLEPASCPGLVGREQAAKSGSLDMLEPGETRSFVVEFSFEDRRAH